MKSLLVFCGSATGNHPAYAAQAAAVGQLLARKNIRLIYGGGKLGMMGILANACLDAGGKVTGIIPGFLVDREAAHPGLTDLFMVDTMHQRKQRMLDSCDAVLTLPGGFGTLDELFEFTTWRALGLHHKPMGLLNTAGFYDPLLAHYQQMLREGFISENRMKELLIGTNAEALIETLLPQTTV